VDFVGEDDDAAPRADFPDLQEIVLRPGVAGRVLRIAENQRVVSWLIPFGSPKSME
jgi:hypothetical protein